MVCFGDHSLAVAGDKGVMHWDVQVTGDTGRTVKVTSHSVVGPIESEARWLHVAVSSDEKLLAYAVDRRHFDEDDQIGVWNLEVGKSVRCTPTRMLQGWHGLAFIPGSHQLTFINVDGMAEVWNVDKDMSLGPLSGTATIPTKSRTSPSTGAAPWVNFGAPHLAMSTSGAWFAGLVKPNSVGIWNTRERKHLFNLRPEPTAIIALAWSPDGKRLALGMSDGGLTVWDLGVVNQELAKLDDRLRWMDVD